MTFLVRGIDTAWVAQIRQGGLDAHGQPAVRRRAASTGAAAAPCRHCLRLIDPGDELLVLAHRPFTRLQPYAESGPIFLHAHDCPRYEATQLPPWLAYLQPALLRGYDHDDWIRYDTAQVLPGTELAEACTRLLDDPGVAYLHIRSKYNCFQCQVNRPTT